MRIFNLIKFNKKIISCALITNTSANYIYPNNTTQFTPIKPQSKINIHNINNDNNNNNNNDNNDKIKIYKKKIFYPNEKYERADIYDEMLKYIETYENEEIYRNVCSLMAEKMTFSIFLIMNCTNKIFFEEIVKKNYTYMKYIPYKHQTTELINISLKKSNFDSICFIDPAKQNEQMAMNAVSRNGLNLKYVRKDLINSTIIFKAIKQNGTAIKYVDEKEITKELLVLAVNSNPSDYYMFVQENIYKKMMTKELLLLTVISCPNILVNLSEEEQTEEMIYCLINKNLMNYSIMTYIKNNNLKKKAIDYMNKYNIKLPKYDDPITFT